MVVDAKWEGLVCRKEKNSLSQGHDKDVLLKPLTGTFTAVTQYFSLTYIIFITISSLSKTYTSQA